MCDDLVWSGIWDDCLGHVKKKNYTHELGNKSFFNTQMKL